MVEDRRLAPRFERLPDRPGFVVVDPIERRQYTIHTPTPVAPTEVDGAPFDVPVDVAAEFSTGRIVLPEVVDVFVHDSGGDVVRVQPVTEAEFEGGRYQVELSAPIKLYFEARGPFVVSAGMDEIAIDFQERRDVQIGARSYHERPATTLRTTADPGDVMATVSYLGSALKTTSPERSYPTLRGHPPAIEVGAERSIPASLERPDTGVTLEMPADLSAVFAAAPLAYYLGADVQPASKARLVTDDGFEWPLADEEDDYEVAIERLLKHVFLLDCVTRTEGYYQFDLHEREAVEARVDLDFADLYDRPLARQVEAYLEVPYDEIAEHVPRWPLTAHVAPDSEHVEALPYVVDDLAVVRTTTGGELSPGEVRTEAFENFMEGRGFRRATDPGRVDRSDGESDDPLRVVGLPDTDSRQEAWFGEGVALHATKAVVQAYRNRFDRDPHEGPIEITVVCNEREMAGENDVATDVYGSRADLPFDVTLRRNLTVDELAAAFSSGTDFVHYVGHIDDDGFQCRDGVFDAGTLDQTDADAFFLNACRSYEQGIRLVEAGATGGVVTISDVINTSAVRVGRAVARLLNLGFSLHAALGIARDQSVLGSHYVVLGDGSADVVSARNVVPVVCDVGEVGEDEYELTLSVFIPTEGGVGGTFLPTIRDDDCHYLIPGEIETYRLTEAELTDYLEWHPYPIRTEEGIVWNDGTGSVEL